MNFKNKVAIVTGAGQGIGLEICKKLSVAGASIVLNDIDAALGQKAITEINDHGGSCKLVVGDCSDIRIIHEMIEMAVPIFGRLDIAIANAGITLYGNSLAVMGRNIAGNPSISESNILQYVQRISMFRSRRLITSPFTGA